VAGGLPWKELIVYGAEVFIEDVTLWFRGQSPDALPYAQLDCGHQLACGFLLAHHAASLYTHPLTLHAHPLPFPKYPLSFCAIPAFSFPKYPPLFLFQSNTLYFHTPLTPFNYCLLHLHLPLPKQKIYPQPFPLSILGLRYLARMFKKFIKT
jgi:hypothetical protein